MSDPQSGPKESLIAEFFRLVGEIRKDLKNEEKRKKFNEQVKEVNERLNKIKQVKGRINRLRLMRYFSKERRELSRKLNSLTEEVIDLYRELINEFNDILGKKDTLIDYVKQLNEEVEKMKQQLNEDEKKEKEEKKADGATTTQQEAEQNDVKEKAEGDSEEEKKEKDPIQEYLDNVHRLVEINRRMDQIKWRMRSGIAVAAMNVPLAAFAGLFLGYIPGMVIGVWWIIRRERKKRLSYRDELKDLAVEAAGILGKMGELRERALESYNQRPNDPYNQAAKGFLRDSIEFYGGRLHDILRKRGGQQGWFSRIGSIFQRRNRDQPDPNQQGQRINEREEPGVIDREDERVGVG